MSQSSDLLLKPPLRPPFSQSDDPLAGCSPACLHGKTPCHHKNPSQVSCASESRTSLTLPAVYHNQSHSLQTIEETNEHSIRNYLEWELTVPRLNEIHGNLWLAGRPMGARPLHRQAMLGRDLVTTEQVDLHMVRQGTRIFVKPMPDFLLDHEFWKDHICRDTNLYECGCGFLLSYVWLVCSKSDLRMAQDAGLLGPEINWENWTSFTRSLLRTIDIQTLEQVNQRYHYGELRLSRLNWIYRLTSKNRSHVTLIRGYMYGYTRYSEVVQRNFGWVLVAFVYGTIVLTAMQVGLATDRLGQSDMFQNASYGFTVFSILTPLIIIAILGLNLLSLSAFNVFATISFKRRTERARRGFLGGKSSGVP